MQSSVTVCLLLLISVHAHIVTDFQECMKYFYNGHVPQWAASNNHIHICQIFENQYCFATLYDRSNRIPVYSAYVVNDKSVLRRGASWMVEPQLVDQNFEKEMMTAETLIYKHPSQTLSEIGQRQALNDDYKSAPKGYNRGHLNPDSHHTSYAAKATYTLTNIVPQKESLNKGKWKDHEDKLTGFAINNQVFALVGAIPSSENWIVRNGENRVNIPDYMWIAYCYFDNQSKSFKSGGATAKNTENKLYECSLNELQEFLKEHAQQQGQLFHEDCYVKKNVAAPNPCMI